ncbi:transposase family protein [Streptomyces sp. NPDC126497]|uniref:transposase family protein n=1 Tax=Streptomyces sp. NPDC126497 TaxID=3155313 RepID=UPI003321BA0B
MLVYPSGVDVFSSALRFLAARLREHRRALGTRWRRLNAGRQALLTLAHLRNGQPYAQLAAGFGIGTTTAYRYITEAVNLLAALTEAVRAASAKAYVILSGTLLPIDRIADPKGRLMWVSPALAGAVHDVRAAREHSIIEALAEAGITCWADKGYQGAGGTVRLPYRGRWGSLSTGQQAVNRSHAKIRALVEQAIATLKSWRLLRKLRCSTTRITSLVQAVLVLQLAATG